MDDWVEVIFCAACKKAEVTPCDGYAENFDVRGWGGSRGNYRCTLCWEKGREAERNTGSYRHLPRHCLAVDDGNRE